MNTETNYLVVDAGAGTIDVTAHKILDAYGTDKELRKVSYFSSMEHSCG